MSASDVTEVRRWEPPHFCMKLEESTVSHTEGGVVDGSGVSSGQRSHVGIRSQTHVLGLNGERLR